MKAEEFVKTYHPFAKVVNGFDWFYVKKDKAMMLGGYSIIGKGKTVENAWKSAARRVMKDNG